MRSELKKKTFKTEAEEAEWWDMNQDALADEFEKAAAAGTLGRSRAGNSTAPDWLRKSWESAKQLNLDTLSAEEIDAEIEAARKARRRDTQG